MTIKRFIKYTILFLIITFFAPMGVEHFIKVLNVKSDIGSQTSKAVTARLDNPNSFNREYKISRGSLHTYYRLADNESKIRAIYDTFGIQLYFIEYTLDFEHPNETQEQSMTEVKEWLTTQELDPYGLYHIVAEYDIDYNSPYYDKNHRYWNSQIGVYLVYGEEVDSWWNTDVQLAFEEAADKNDYRIGAYNNYEGFVNSLYNMKVKGCNSHTFNATTSIGLDIFAFCLFTLAPIGLFIVILVHDIKKYKRLKKEEELRKEEESRQLTLEILETPIKTLEEEYVESLKNKYN